MAKDVFEKAQEIADKLDDASIGLGTAVQDRNKRSIRAKLGKVVKYAAKLEEMLPEIAAAKRPKADDGDGFDY